jgi:ribonuclease PH
MDRESVRGVQSGRSVEIQRLIGRSLRSVVDLFMLGERQIKVDCDVIQADGGTRTASITGAYVAIYLACHKLVKTRKILENPIRSPVVAISCGIVDDTPLLDLEYKEDSNAEVDANFVMSDNGVIEMQISGEKRPFTENEFQKIFTYAKKAREELIAKQKVAIGF